MQSEGVQSNDCIVRNDDDEGRQSNPFTTETQDKCKVRNDVKVSPGRKKQQALRSNIDCAKVK